MASRSRTSTAEAQRARQALYHEKESQLDASKRGANRHHET